MRAAVIVFPGSNCDLDTYHVLQNILHIQTELVWYRQRDLTPYDLIVLPGGFSYGDYLRAGAIARFAPAVAALREYIERERGIVLGICNGFQILTEAGLLPGALARNIQGHPQGLPLRRGRPLCLPKGPFICKTVKVRIENNATPFTQLFQYGEVIELPIAHGQGRYVADPQTLQSLKRNRQILLTYYGENPNGSVEGIAGIMNETGTVFGLMPHPERNSEKLLGSGDGLRFFLSLASALTPCPSPVKTPGGCPQGGVRA